jgi:hypothetical protein
LLFSIYVPRIEDERTEVHDEVQLFAHRRDFAPTPETAMNQLLVFTLVKEMTLTG